MGSAEVVSSDDIQAVTVVGKRYVEDLKNVLSPQPQK
jgi:hypothetical protein